MPQTFLSWVGTVFPVIISTRRLLHRDMLIRLYCAMCVFALMRAWQFNNPSFHPTSELASKLNIKHDISV